VRNMLSVGAFFVVAGILTGCNTGTNKGEVDLRGAGSSFVKPIMDRWTTEYTKLKGGSINYQATGSGAGIRSMIDKSVDFGCTDAFMTQVDLDTARDAKGGGKVLHIPLIMGGIVPAYNLEGVDKPVKFTGEILADIYLGKIKKWNDERLQKINEGLSLPDKDIALVRRSDGSGSTNIFTDYLCKVSDEFKKDIGSGTTVKWKVGSGENGTSGVAGFITKTANSLGYIELTYALQNKVAYGEIKNKAGQFVRADLKSVSKAAENSLKEIPPDLRFSLTDAPGEGSYPLSGTTWAVVYAEQSPATAKQLSDFFTWIVHDGQKYAEGLHYAPLPANLVKRIEETIKAIK
jgi:phosphate ABC transporter phosphate-binding protein